MAMAGVRVHFETSGRMNGMHAVMYAFPFGCDVPACGVCGYGRHLVGVNVRFVFLRWVGCFVLGL